MLDTSEKLYGVNEIQSLFDSRGRNRRDMIRTARDTVEGREWHEILAWRDILTDHLRSDYNYFRFRSVYDYFHLGEKERLAEFVCTDYVNADVCERF